MRKNVESLIYGAKRTSGNHHVEYTNGHRKFYYYATCICDADDQNNIVTIDNGGYNTRSTNVAINGYIEYFKSNNYIINDIREWLNKGDMNMIQLDEKNKQIK